MSNLVAAMFSEETCSACSVLLKKRSRCTIDGHCNFCKSCCLGHCYLCGGGDSSDIQADGCIYECSGCKIDVHCYSCCRAGSMCEKCDEVYCKNCLEDRVCSKCTRREQKRKKRHTENNKVIKMKDQEIPFTNSTIKKL